MEWWKDTEWFTSPCGRAWLVSQLSGATVHVKRAAVYEREDDGIEITDYRDYEYQNPQAPSEL